MQPFFFIFALLCYNLEGFLLNKTFCVGVFIMKEFKTNTRSLWHGGAIPCLHFGKQNM